MAKKPGDKLTAETQSSQRPEAERRGATDKRKRLAFCGASVLFYFSRTLRVSAVKIGDAVKSGIRAATGVPAQPGRTERAPLPSRPGALPPSVLRTPVAPLIPHYAHF